MFFSFKPLLAAQSHVQLEDIHSYLECKRPYNSQKRLSTDFVSNLKLHVLVKVWVFHIMEKPNNFRNNYMFTFKIHQSSPKFFLHNCHQMHNRAQSFPKYLSVAVKCEHLRTTCFEEKFHSIYSGHHGDDCSVTTRASFF